MAGLLLPLVAYLIIRSLTGSSVAALAITDAKNVAKLNPDRPEIAARLAEPGRRRVVTILTAVIGATFAIDGASQIALALTVPTTSFVADSTGARIAVLGTGAVVTIWYLRLQKKRLDRGPRSSAHAERE
jgi:hypothetical protein